MDSLEQAADAGFSFAVQPQSDADLVALSELRPSRFGAAVSKITGQYGHAAARAFTTEQLKVRLQLLAGCYNAP